jgi:Uma2 family endonuclease
LPSAASARAIWVEIEEAADGVLLETAAAGEPCSGHVPRAYRSIMTTSREARVMPERMELAEFLAWEAAQEVRHERIGGTVFAMTGGTLAHNTIALNLVVALRQRLAGTDCRVFAADVRVVTPRGDVMYPDVVIACGERRDSDKEIRDPVVVVEVPSGSTEERDHGSERWAYARLPSLRHDVLIAQDRAEAEVSASDGEVWRGVYLRDPGASLRLEALGIELALADALTGVELIGTGAAAGAGGR